MTALIIAILAVTFFFIFFVLFALIFTFFVSMLIAGIKALGAGMIVAGIAQILSGCAGCIAAFIATMKVSEFFANIYARACYGPQTYSKEEFLDHVRTIHNGSKAKQYNEAHS